jgi:hypothetical protein
MCIVLYVGNNYICVYKLYYKIKGLKCLDWPERNWCKSITCKEDN